MKKQILILAIFTLAIFAGNFKSYGQALDQHITGIQIIDPLSCVATSLPLHPYPNQSYTYTMDGTTGEETAANWTWWATKDVAFIPSAGNNNIASMLTTPGDLIAVGASYGVTTTTNSVDITWSPQILAATEYQGDATAAGTPAAPSPTFVVGYATGTTCADNIQVWEINPSVNFTIDIANIDPLTGATMAWDAPTTQCVDVVQLATYDNASKELNMDYGTNTLYFEVAAANFNTDWTPTFNLISGLVGVQTAVVTFHASYADAAADASIIETMNWTAASVGGAFTTTNNFTASTPAEVTTGVSLFVKVVISNLTEESLTSNIFNLAVDAIDYSAGTGVWDMEDADCSTLDDSADLFDQVSHTVLPRPTLEQDDAAMGEGNGTNPDEVIIKTP